MTDTGASTRPGATRPGAGRWARESSGPPRLLRVLTALALAFAGSAGARDLGRGWSLDGYGEGEIVVRADRSSAGQNPSATLDVRLSGKPYPFLRPYLELRGVAGGPTRGGEAGVIDPRDTFQDVSPSLEIEEAYCDVLGREVELRVGKQKFAWGRLDAFTSTDVLNPRSFLDPFLHGGDEAKLGIPGVRATGFPRFPWENLLTDARVTLVWVPFPTAGRLARPGERWFPSATAIPTRLDFPESAFFSLSPPLHVRTHLRAADGVAWRLDRGGGALRVAARSGPVDWGLMFYDGPETAPSARLATTVVSPSARRKVQAGEMPVLDPDLTHLVADSTLESKFGRIAVVGGDLGFQLGGLIVRAEWAYGADRLLPRPGGDLLSQDAIIASVGPMLDKFTKRLLQGRRVRLDLGPLFVPRDTIDWGIGVDYAVGGWLPVLQVSQTVLLGDGVRLLVPEVDTRLVLGLRKQFLGERVEMELALIQGFERSYTAATGSVSYAITDNLRARAGYVVLGGSRNTLIGQYKNNDELFFRLRWSF